MDPRFYRLVPPGKDAASKITDAVFPPQSVKNNSTRCGLDFGKHYRSQVVPLLSLESLVYTVSVCDWEDEMLIALAVLS